jgi:hypothetical protein
MLLQSTSSHVGIQTGSYVTDSLDLILMDEHIRKHIYMLKLPTIVRLHPVFHVNNLRPYSTASLRQVVPRTVRDGDDEEFEVSHIVDLCIKSLP